MNGTQLVISCILCLFAPGWGQLYQAKYDSTRTAMAFNLISATIVCAGLFVVVIGFFLMPLIWLYSLVECVLYAMSKNQAPKAALVMFLLLGFGSQLYAQEQFDDDPATVYIAEPVAEVPAPKVEAPKAETPKDSEVKATEIPKHEDKVIGGDGAVNGSTVTPILPSLRSPSFPTPQSKVLQPPAKRPRTNTVPGTKKPAGAVCGPNGCSLPPKASAPPNTVGQEEYWGRRRILRWRFR